MSFADTFVFGAAVSELLAPAPHAAELFDFEEMRR